jgi:zinc/manganese transport system substrate-binding protein
MATAHHHHHRPKLSRNQSEILACLRRAKEPMSAYAILDRVRISGISHPPTVYPDGKSAYEANAAKYLAAITEEEGAVKAALGALPEARRKIITSHDAFGYFGKAYGLEIIAPQGVSTESEASAQDVAKIIRQIKQQKIPAVFIENITDRRLLDQIARETNAKIGGALYSDALSEADGPAPTYLDMFRHNVGAITAALSS